ncbi:MAG: flagellar hook-basal body complex protein [bacterium]|nr:flagellar hook-basal body complex protein [bacterium]
MLQAMYTGISGIKAYQEWFDAIGHNVANTQTIGYKKNRAIFEDLMSHSVKSAISPNERGGENGKQIGTGVTNAQIQVIHLQGSIEETGKTTDLAIKGEGFFIMKEVECHLAHYTRAGAFDFDAKGNLVNPSNGLHVQGWMAERDTYGRLVIGADNKTTVDTSKNLQNIRIVEGDKMLGRKTENLELSSNLNKDQAIAIDPIYIKLTAPAVSTDETVTVNFGYDKDGVYVYEDEHKNWRYRDGKIAEKPDVVRNALDTAKSFSDAGWDRVPDGTVTINGATFNLADYETVDDFISAVNKSTEANVTISYDPIKDKWTIKNDLPGRPLELSDNPKTVSFFEEAKIITGNIEPKEIRIEFMHLLDPQNPDNNYYRFTPVDAKTGEAITPQVMSNRQVIEGFDKLDLTKPPTVAFGVNNPDGRITINDYTSKSLKEYASLEALFTEINESEDAGVVIGYNPKIDRIEIKNKVAGRALTLSEEKVDNRTGVDIKGQFLDEVDVIGKMDGKVVGKVEGTIVNNGTVTGITEGLVYATSCKGTITGHMVGNVSGNVEGKGLFAGDAVFFEGGIKGAVTEKNTSTPAYIRGTIKSGDVSDIGVVDWNGGINGKMEGRIKGALRCRANAAESTSDVSFDLTGKINTKQITDSNANLQALVDVEGLTIISGSGDLATWTNCVSGTIEGHIQGLVGDANIGPMAGAGGADAGDIPTNPQPGEDYTFTIPADIINAAIITGTIEGISAGRIEAYVEGDVWDENGAYKGYLKQNIDGYYMVSGKVTGFVNGISLGTVDGKVTGTIFAKTTAADTNLPEAIIEGTIKGEINDGEVVVEGRVSSRDDTYDDHIWGMVDVEGHAGEIADVNNDGNFDDLYANLYGTFEGTLLGNAEGWINGLVKHCKIDAQEMEGSGYLTRNATGYNYALIKWDGTIEGELNDNGDTTITPTSAVGQEIKRIMDGYENPGAELDNEYCAYVDGTVDGTINLSDTNDRIHGVAEGIINATDTASNAYAISGHIIGEVDTAGDGGKFVGDYKGIVEEAVGTIDGKIDGTLESTSNVDAKFEGKAEGVIDGRMIGYCKGTLSGVGDVDGYMDVIGTLTGTFEGTVTRSGGTTAGIMITGVMDGVAEGKVKGQVDAKVTNIPGLFERMYIPTGTEKATSGILELEVGEDGVERVVNAYRDTDANSPNPAHRSNNLLDLTEEIPTDEDIWDQVTTDGNAYFEVNIGGNDVAVLLPSGNTRPEEITFAPNTTDEAGDTIKVDYMVSSTAELNKDRIYNKGVHIYDSLGNELSSRFQFERLGTNMWLWTLRNPSETERLAGYGIAIFNSDGTYNKDFSIVGQSPSDPMTFDADGGSITGAVTGESRSIGYQGIYINPPELPYPWDQGGSPPAEYGADVMRINLNLDGLTQFAQHDSNVTVKQDGYGIGYLEDIQRDVNINKEGEIIGEYTNGQRVVLAQLALATFVNPSGLAREAGTMFLETANSGEAKIGTPGTMGKGTLVPGALELSNVNVTEEFVNMVLSERAYMISSRVITQADRMLMDLMRMRM